MIAAKHNQNTKNKKKLKGSKTQNEGKTHKKKDEGETTAIVSSLTLFYQPA